MNKSIEYIQTKKAFTLLELLLVIAIIAVLAGLIVFALNPASTLQEATDTRELSRISDLEKAIKTYVIENNGSYPFSTTNLTQTAYSICTYGQTTNCGVNIDNLVSGGYIQAIPTNTYSIGNTTGYMLKYSNTGIEIGKSKINCPAGYVTVPGNSIYQTDDFCVMKYEAKNVSSIPTSQASGTIWVSISQVSAASTCSSLGSNYHLITNNEWMTIARNIEQVASNWSGAAVGTGFLYSGHSDSLPANALNASTDDNDGYNGTGNVAPSNQRRTLTLSNGEVIWDLAGNVWEWTNNNINCASTTCTVSEMPYDTTPADEWIELTSVAGYGQLSYDLSRPTNNTWNSTQGFGRIFTDSTANNLGGVTHAFIRGGRWTSSADSGVLALFLDNAPTYSVNFIGFRCVYNQ